MYVQIKNNVLFVDRGTPGQEEKGLRNAVMNAVQMLAPKERTVLKGISGHFHRRFGHLNYVNVERMTADPVNRIESGRTV